MDGKRLVRCFSVMFGVGGISAAAIAQQPAISIDGEFADWAGVAPTYIDTAGDAAATSVDFHRIWLANDDRFLFIRFETTIDVDLSEFNGLALYIDGDNSITTGTFINGIGAELDWRFGQRNGTFYSPGGSTFVTQHNLRLRGGPTVTVADYEIAIARDARPNGVTPLFTSSTIRLQLRDLFGGDHAPNLGQTLSYAFDALVPPPPEPIPLERRSDCDLRIATYNVLFDSIFNEQLQPRFRRLLTATAPDVILFQEIYNHSAEEVASLLDEWLPLPGGDVWSGVRNADCHVISRYPIIGMWPRSGNVAALIDTTERWGRPTLVISAHPPCCTNENGRQFEIDELMALVRDAIQPGGVLTLPADSPIIIGGDMNLVGLSQQLRTLLTGDIVNNGPFGSDFSPDWDQSPLRSITPRQSHKRMGYTWRDDANSFWPGHLDFLIYSDSVIRSPRSFVLYTPEIDNPTLIAYDLYAEDSLGSDHLLFCADFRLGSAIPGDLDDDGAVDLEDLSTLLAHFGAPAPQPPTNGDVDGDGDVDLSDLSTMLSRFGATC